MTSLNNQLSMSDEVLQSIIQMQNSRTELWLNRPQTACSAVALRFLDISRKEMLEKPYHNTALSKHADFLLFLFLLIDSRSAEMPLMLGEQSLWALSCTRLVKTSGVYHWLVSLHLVLRRCLEVSHCEMTMVCDAPTCFEKGTVGFQALLCAKQRRIGPNTSPADVLPPQ